MKLILCLARNLINDHPPINKPEPPRIDLWPVFFTYFNHQTLLIHQLTYISPEINVMKTSAIALCLQLTRYQKILAPIIIQRPLFNCSINDLTVNIIINNVKHDNFNRIHPRARV